MHTGNWVPHMKNTGFCFLFFPCNGEFSIVCRMLWKWRHQLAQFAGGSAGQKSPNVCPVLAFFHRCHRFGCCQKEDSGLDGSWSVTVWLFFCQWSGPGVTTSSGSLAASFTLSGQPCFVSHTQPIPYKKFDVTGRAGLSGGFFSPLH